MNAISCRINRNKGLFRETAELGRQYRKTQMIPNSSSAKTALRFEREKVIQRLRQLPPNVNICDFDQTITAVKSSKDYYEEFKKVRTEKQPILLRKNIAQLAILRFWSMRFPNQFNKLAFYRFLLPGLSIDNIVQRLEINPNFIKVVKIIEQYRSDYIFGICSVGIGQIVEKIISKIGIKGYDLILNIYEEEGGVLTGNLKNDYLFT